MLSAEASLNHGFASHIVRPLQCDVLGVDTVDPLRKHVLLRFGDGKLEWCEGTVPTPDGSVHLHWWQEGGSLAYHVEAPRGYRVTIENRSGKPLAAR